MTIDADKTPSSRWRTWWPQLVLSVSELAIALGLGFAVFVGAMAVGCRALSPACDSTGGLAVVAVGIVVSIGVATAYWVLALVLGLSGWRRTRYGLDAVVAAIAVTNFAVLQWRDRGAQVQYRAAAEAAARSEVAAREAWIAALQQNPDGHGAPGVVPPMLTVIDDGRSVQVTNITQEWLVVALARVLPDNQREWRACPLLTVGEVSDYYRFSIGPGRTARYAPLPDCAASFEGAALEYRVGDPRTNAPGWWSDSAFAAPTDRVP